MLTYVIEFLSGIVSLDDCHYVSVITILLSDLIRTEVAVVRLNKMQGLCAGPTLKPVFFAKCYKYIITS